MAEIRLPLSLGVTCLTDLAVGVIAVPVGVAIACAGLMILYWAGSDLGDGLKLVIGMLIFGCGTTFLGARAAFRAWRYRPSDLLVGDTGIRIVGGYRHGFAADWAAIAQAQCQISASKPTLITIWGLLMTLLETDIDERYYHFRVGPDLVAETDDKREADSFREIAAAMLERAAPPVDAESPTPAAPAEAPDGESKGRRRRKQPRKLASPPSLPHREIAILTCTKCGGAVSPGTEAEVACSHCETMVAIPMDLRERVLAAATLSVHAKRAVRVVEKLLDQPSGRQVSRWIAISTLFIAAAWPLTVAAYVHLARVHRLSFELGALLAVLPFLLVLDGFFLSRLRLVDRLALRSLALTFGALPPVKPGDAPCCRQCLGPLPTVTATIVPCAYCGTANVTRVDLRGRAKRTASSAVSLEHALAGHDRERLWWRLATLVGAGCFVATAALLRHVWH